LTLVRILALLLAALLVASVPAAAQKTDIVVTLRGDRITCEVQRLERGRLVVTTDDMGTVNIEWDKVRELTAAANFEIDDESGSRYLGSLGAGTAAGEMILKTRVGELTLPMHSVVRIQRIGSGFWQRVDGSIDVGASYTSSSDLLKIDMSSTATYRQPLWEVTLAAESSITRQPEAPETRRNEGSLQYLRLMRWKRWLTFGQGEVSQNVELGYDLRTAATGGAGRFMLQRVRDRLTAAGGLSVNREWPVDGEKQSNVEALGWIAYDYVTYDSPKTDIGASVAVLPSLSDPGRVRSNIDAHFSREVFKDFFLKISFYERYDNRPPTESAAHHDYGSTLSFGWSF
jgi:hypothetical protein